MPNYRADLYAAGPRWQRTERYDASNPVEAVETARQKVVAHEAADGNGHTTYIAKVGAER